MLEVNLGSVDLEVGNGRRLEMKEIEKIVSSCES
jgi:hypothetical protein